MINQAILFSYFFTLLVNFVLIPSCREYGDEAVKSIKQHFSSVLNQDLDETELLNEWFLLKALVYEKYAKHNYK
jgi:hypothetical protein